MLGQNLQLRSLIITSSTCSKPREALCGQLVCSQGQTEFIDKFVQFQCQLTGRYATAFLF